MRKLDDDLRPSIKSGDRSIQGETAWERIGRMAYLSEINGKKGYRKSRCPAENQRVWLYSAAIAILGRLGKHIILDKVLV